MIGAILLAQYFGAQAQTEPTNEIAVGDNVYRLEVALDQDKVSPTIGSMTTGRVVLTQNGVPVRSFPPELLGTREGAETVELTVAGVTKLFSKTNANRFNHFTTGVFPVPTASLGTHLFSPQATTDWDYGFDNTLKVRLNFYNGRADFGFVYGGEATGEQISFTATWSGLSAALTQTTKIALGESVATPNWLARQSGETFRYQIDFGTTQVNAGKEKSFEITVTAVNAKTGAIEKNQFQRVQLMAVPATAKKDRLSAVSTPPGTFALTGPTTRSWYAESSAGYPVGTQPAEGTQNWRPVTTFDLVEGVGKTRFTYKGEDTPSHQLLFLVTPTSYYGIGQVNLQEAYRQNVQLPRTPGNTSFLYREWQADDSLSSSVFTLAALPIGETESLAVQNLSGLPMYAQANETPPDEEKEPSPTPEPEPEPIVEPGPTPTTPPSGFQWPKINFSIWGWLAIAPIVLVGLILGLLKMRRRKRRPITTSDMAIAAAPATSTITNVPASRPRRRSGWMGWLIVGLIIIGGGMTWWMIKNPSSITDIPGDHPPIADQPPPVHIYAGEQYLNYEFRRGRFAQLDEQGEYASSDATYRLKLTWHDNYLSPAPGSRLKGTVQVVDKAGLQVRPPVELKDTIGQQSGIRLLVRTYGIGSLNCTRPQECDFVKALDLATSHEATISSYLYSTEANIELADRNRLVEQWIDISSGQADLELVYFGGRYAPYFEIELISAMAPELFVRKVIDFADQHQPDTISLPIIHEQTGNIKYAASFDEVGSTATGARIIQMEIEATPAITGPDSLERVEIFAAPALPGRVSFIQPTDAAMAPMNPDRLAEIKSQYTARRVSMTQSDSLFNNDGNLNGQITLATLSTDLIDGKATIYFKLDIKDDDVVWPLLTIRPTNFITSYAQYQDPKLPERPTDVAYGTGFLYRRWLPDDSLTRTNYLRTSIKLVIPESLY